MLKYILRPFKIQNVECTLLVTAHDAEIF